MALLGQDRSFAFFKRDFDISSGVWYAVGKMHAFWEDSLDWETTEQPFDKMALFETESLRIPVFDGNRVARVVTVIHDATEQKLFEEQSRFGP